LVAVKVRKVRQQLVVPAVEHILDLVLQELADKEALVQLVDHRLLGTVAVAAELAKLEQMELLLVVVKAVTALLGFHLSIRQLQRG
jgi:hypothetical protein